MADRGPGEPGVVYRPHRLPVAELTVSAAVQTTELSTGRHWYQPQSNIRRVGTGTYVYNKVKYTLLPSNYQLKALTRDTDTRNKPHCNSD